MPSLSSLVKKGKWDQVGELLKTSDIDDTPRSYKCCDGCYARHNILHYVLNYKPPVSIVRSITELFPEAANEVDCMLRYPFHVALVCGVSLDIIRHLIKFNVKAVSAIDCDGKTALHLLFIDYKIRSKLNSTKFKEWRQNLPDIIHMICHQDPKLILKEDANETSVLEIALQEEVEHPIVKMLQIIAESAMKGKDLSWFCPPLSCTKTINEGSVRRSSQVGKIVKTSRKTITSRTA